MNPQDGWIEVVTNGGPGAGSESVDIFRTTDGGQVWKKVASTGAQSGLPLGGLKSGISFNVSGHSSPVFSTWGGMTRSFFRTFSHKVYD